MHIHFVLISEGHADEGLLPHLENLCIEAGATEVTGVAPDFRRLPHPTGHSMQEKLRATLRLEPEANLFLLHRDADTRDPEPRYREISTAVAACRLTKRWAAVVPIQETEAWILLDETAIRRAVGKPNGTNKLSLPTAHDVETIARPKERLKQVLADAAQAKGRRLAQLNRDFPAYRRRLLLGLTTDGRVKDVPSWRRMRDDIYRALELLQQDTSSVDAAP